MRSARFATLFLAVLAACQLPACVTPPAKKTLAAGAGGSAAMPETMTFSAEAEAGPAAAQLGKLLARLEEAQRWDRPLLMSTVARRLAIPLPPACAGWGHVGVYVPPPAPEAEVAALDAPVTRFLFVVREQKPVDPEQVEGPEGEPASKKGAQDAPGGLVRTCAALLVRGTTSDRVRIGVMPVHTGEGTPRVLTSSELGGAHLVHLGTGPGDQPGPFAWTPGHLLLLFTHGALRSVGSWPEEADPLPRDWRFVARLQGSTGFGRAVLLLVTETETDPDPEADTDPDTNTDPGTPPAAAPAAAPSATAITRCAWIDAQGTLTAIGAPDRARLASEAGFAGCAAPPVPTPEAFEEGVDVP